MRIEIIKAIGPDYIPKWVLRDCAPLLVPHLHAYSTRALEKATYQLCLISPVPKIHPPQNLQKDLRPISLTPVISNQLEFFLYKRLIDCVHDKIDPLQFGALKGSSTVHALFHMLHDWYLNTDNSSSKQFIRILLIGYSKAFDRINPLILIDKLKALQVPDVLLNVISSFLIMFAFTIFVFYSCCYPTHVYVVANKYTFTLLYFKHTHP